MSSLVEVCRSYSQLAGDVEEQSCGRELLVTDGVIFCGEMVFVMI